MEVADMLILLINLKIQLKLTKDEINDGHLMVSCLQHIFQPSGSSDLQRSTTLLS